MSAERAMGEPVLGDAIGGLYSAEIQISMPRKVANFLKDWLTPICLGWLIVSQGWEKVFADRNQDREIVFLKEITRPVPGLTNTVNIQSKDIEELKRGYFKAFEDISRFNRNLDRIGWVVEAIAEKNGIKVPAAVER